ncbi:MAG: 16S rRNA (cytosine(1402)-N(4))-methyltransferase RsmH [Bdellovibrionaceae bacterium]|nr:16S rRNA (cytosine(1402)-N(4))-methyltransferase RsmH [Pseudobdellovibrionaceae bacterium]
MENSGHIPVMMQEVLALFAQYNKEPVSFLDGTFGRGGHCTALLKHYPTLSALGVDRDEAALQYAHDNYGDLLSSQRLRLWQGSYREYAEQMSATDIFDFILLDLGVSSPQLDDESRGFSFYGDGPLDMRMGRKQKTTAADVINTWSEEELIEIFKNYGEVHSPYRVVRAVVHDRKTTPFSKTQQLAGLIERVEGWRQKGRHPATQYFLALRLVVNTELEDLQVSLPLFIRALKPGGILAVITFHSLEDRITKNLFKDHLDIGQRMNKKVIIPTDEEIKINPRSRSAKLRGFLKTPAQKRDPTYYKD